MFKKSLFRELGKNTGKWASNKLFGDNWSTPYRFSNSGAAIAKQALKIEKEIEEKKVDNQLELKKLQYLFTQSRNSNKIKNEIIAMPLPENSDDLFTFANFMLSNIYGTGWDHDDEKSYLNDFSNVCLNKLEQCKIMFNVNGALFETKYLEKEIRTLKRKRFFEKYGIIVFAIIFFGVLIYINYLLGHFNDF
ncbi:hypothetical protein N9H71_02565 [Flavobacteriaceae bacterium]|nr:hypothetical protein [Flavobacteriaceae bacterium]